MRLQSRDMHRHPLGRAHEFDVDFPINPSPQEFAADLIDHRFTFALLAISEVMTRRDVRSHRLPDDPHDCTLEGPEVPAKSQSTLND